MDRIRPTCLRPLEAKAVDRIHLDCGQRDQGGV
jgi:hypothetical protein